MPPFLAAILTLTFVALLIIRDSRNHPETSGALWLPVAWFFITGSRFVSQWMNLGSPDSVDLNEGSPIDALFFLALIISGFTVLVRRRVSPASLLRNNAWLGLFLLYSFLAILWSDFPFIACKRWIKTLGHPVMALIILTDAQPVHALRTVIRRCAYLMLPLSILFIKYYPQYGRVYDIWSGQAYNQGIANTKNGLGYLCMVFGIFFYWNLLNSGCRANPRLQREEKVLDGGFLLLTCWLLHIANSSTSAASLVMGISTLTVLGFPFVNKRYLGTYAIVIVLLAGLAQSLFDIYSIVLNLLGRDPTLTDRTNIWAECLPLVDNPLLGAGFESFWLGPRLDILWRKWPWSPNQSHNGYIETYLNLGILGGTLLVASIVSCFRTLSRGLLWDFEFSRLRMAWLIAIVAYNYAEAAFKGVHPLWTVFYLIALHYYPRSMSFPAPEIPGSAPSRHRRVLPTARLRGPGTDRGFPQRPLPDSSRYRPR
jgi:exopolysaccharide production protein ExoQ